MQSYNLTLECSLIFGMDTTIFLMSGFWSKQYTILLAMHNDNVDGS